jgi:hypothetical protein
MQAENSRVSRAAVLEKGPVMILKKTAEKI